MHSRKIFYDLGGVALLASVSILAGFSINLFRDDQMPLVYEDKGDRIAAAVTNLQVPAQPALETPAEQLPEQVSLAQFQALVEGDKALVLDARPEIFHRLGHVPGAISLPRDDFENAYQAARSGLEADKGQPIVIYCSSSSCEDSELVREGLKALGYTQVAVFKGGWSEWEAAGLPQIKNL